MRMWYPRHLNIGPADSPAGSCELLSGVMSLNNGESIYMLAEDNKPWCYMTGLPELVYMPRICPRVL